MPAPIDIACGACAQQPGEPCNGNPPFPPIDSELGVHFARIEATNFINAVDAGRSYETGEQPSPTQFSKAVMATGVV